MGEKRKLPARASARVESSTKKRKSTPPEPSKAPTPTPVVVEEVLPKNVVAGKPLPTVPEPQPENLSTKEYKSIPERYVGLMSLQGALPNLWLIFSQWSTFGVLVTIEAPMGLRGHIRAILDKAKEGQRAC